MPRNYRTIKTRMMGFHVYSGQGYVCMMMLLNVILITRVYYTWPSQLNKYRIFVFEKALNLFFLNVSNNFYASFWVNRNVLTPLQKFPGMKTGKLTYLFWMDISGYQYPWSRICLSIPNRIESGSDKEYSRTSWTIVFTWYVYSLIESDRASWPWSLSFYLRVPWASTFHHHHLQ